MYDSITLSFFAIGHHLSVTLLNHICPEVNCAYLKTINHSYSKVIADPFFFQWLHTFKCVTKNLIVNKTTHETERACVKVKWIAFIHLYWDRKKITMACQLLHKILAKQMMAVQIHTRAFNVFTFPLLCSKLHLRHSHFDLDVEIANTWVHSQFRPNRILIFVILLLEFPILHYSFDYIMFILYKQ